MANSTSTIPLPVHYRHSTRCSPIDESGRLTSAYTKWLENKIYGLYYRIQVSDRINGKKIAAFTAALKSLRHSTIFDEDEDYSVREDWVDHTLDHISKLRLSNEERQAVRDRIHREPLPSKETKYAHGKKDVDSD